MGPGNINAKGKQKLQEAGALSSTKTALKPPNCQNGKPGTDPKAKKPTAIDCVKSNLGLSNSVMTTQSSSVAATEKSNDEEEGLASVATAIAGVFANCGCVI